MTAKATCALCGHPMPPGEEMFTYHGYSGPCPGPMLASEPVAAAESAHGKVIEECAKICDVAAPPRRWNDGTELSPREIGAYRRCAKDLARHLRQFPPPQPEGTILVPCSTALLAKMGEWSEPVRMKYDGTALIVRREPIGSEDASRDSKRLDFIEQTGGVRMYVAGGPRLLQFHDNVWSYRTAALRELGDGSSSMELHGASSLREAVDAAMVLEAHDDARLAHPLEGNA